VDQLAAGGLTAPAGDAIRGRGGKPRPRFASGCGMLTACAALDASGGCVIEEARPRLRRPKRMEEKMGDAMLGRRDVLRLGGMTALAGIGGGLLPGMPAFAQGAAALKPASIINAGGDTTLVLQEMVKQLGYLESLGIKGTTQNLGDGTKVMAALFNGEQDITLLTGLSQVFPAVEKGAKMKVLGGGGLLPLFAVYSKKPEVQKLKDLEGKTVGVASLGALQHVLMVALLTKKGIDLSKVKFVNVGSSADVFRAAAAGTVDAAASSINVFDSQAQYGVHSLPDGNMWEQIPEYTFQGIFATDEAIAKKRDILVHVMAAYAKLYRFLQGPDSKEAFVKAWQTVLSGKDAARTRQEAEFQWGIIQKYKPYAVNLALEDNRIEYLQKLNIQLGSQTKVIPASQCADMSLARDAIKLIS
jgi:ABC-type nitrate/sulfonate/bicarbonate transport system substrate-binding protein